jgi:signal transduction histidine kinase
MTPHVLADGGEMGALMRSIDWAKTPLGPVDRWPQALRTTVGLLLRNRFPMLLWWGPKFVQLYNDAYRPIPGAKHPKSLGQTGSECWAEIWHIIGPMVEAPFRGEPATASDDLTLLLDRHGFLEETHFKVAYSPVPDETAQPTGIGGVLATVAETTAAVFGERQLHTLRELGDRAARAKTPDQACAEAAATLAANPRDVPFAVFYLLDETGRTAMRAGACGLRDGDDVAPPAITLDAPSPWPVAQVAEQRAAVLVSDLRSRFTALPCGAWTEPPHTAIVLPLASPEQPRVHGMFIAAVSPHRALDDLYRGFFELAAGQVVTAIRNASAYQEERRRVEALATIDRAKTEFFSNVSHEFRTPLTLMLGPTKDAIDAGAALGGESLQVVYRNELRLLKLVNNLLDFARIEANRAQGSYRPTDLAALTKDLASGFRAAVEAAGLTLRVVCAPLAEPAFVDRDMWEKIVLNLLSNAFKYTFDGSIEVKLEPRGERIELTVSDTGTGIPEHELPRLFDRFHRVAGARGRTHEGSGIGLALVQELVRMHGGTVSVSSRVGQGSAFTVSIPRGSAHLPAERLGDERTPAPVSTRADAYLAEAARWLPDDARTPPPVSTSTPDPTVPRILLADDNADMRDYVRRILARRWDVETAADGAAALAAAERRPPDLILTDVMMPAVDGFGLLQAVRARPALAAIPVIMLSARAGDEARVGGLAAGADDYLVKPFSARELVARVETQLKLRRQHRAAEDARAVAEEATRAKDEFMAMLGHELRNPLAPILTTLQVMKLRASGIFEQERALIDRQVRHVIRLVEDLLDVSRIARGKISLDRVPVDLAETIARGIELASPLLEQRMHHLTVDVDEGLVLLGDKMRLSQVFANLLTNAAKYTPSSGTIAVTAKRVPHDDMVRVSVKDSGIGMRPEMLPVVFDLFVQGRQGLDRSEGGLGLGLSIVKSLVLLHHGSVEAHSAGPGRGSEFVVLLPSAPASVLNAAASHAAVAEVARTNTATGRRVLVVDDNEDAAASLAEALVDLGHQVEVAHDGPAALAKLETFAPDIALLDIGLPLMDGYELARRIRHEPQLSKIRLVSITGYGQQSDRVRAREAGFDVHLVKPVELGDIERAIAGAPN